MNHNENCPAREGLHIGERLSAFNGGALAICTCNDISPTALAERQYKMSRHYNELTQELAGLKKNKAVEWLEIRKTAKTNKEADMQWEASSNGQRYVEIKTLLDGLGREISGGNALGYSLRSNNY